MDGMLGPPVSLVTEKVLSSASSLSVFVLPKYCSLKNVNFAPYDFDKWKTVPGQDASYSLQDVTQLLGNLNQLHLSFDERDILCKKMEYLENILMQGFERIDFTDELFGDSTILKTILFPLLSKDEMYSTEIDTIADSNDHARQSSAIKKCSVMHILENFAKLRTGGYLFIEGLVKTGKTMICKVLLPMVLSRVEATKDNLFLYLDLNTIEADTFEAFCEEFFSRLEDWVKVEALCGLNFETPKPKPGRTTLSHVIGLVKAVNNRFKLVLVIDEAQKISKFSKQHSTQVRGFLKNLYLLTEQYKYMRLVFAGSEVISLWYDIMNTDTNGHNMRGAAVMLSLPNSHPSQLIEEVNQLLSFNGFLAIPDYIDSAPFPLTTAAQIIEVSKQLSKSGRIELGFKRFLDKIVFDYNQSLAHFLRYIAQKEPKIFYEIIEIAAEEKMVDNLEDLKLYNHSVTSCATYKPLLKLMYQKTCEDGKIHITLKSSAFKFYIQTIIIGVGVQNFLDDVNEVPLYIDSLTGDFKAIRALDSYSRIDSNKVTEVVRGLFEDQKTFGAEILKYSCVILNMPFNTGTRRKILNLDVNDPNIPYVTIAEITRNPYPTRVSWQVRYIRYLRNCAFHLDVFNELSNQQKSELRKVIIPRLSSARSAITTPKFRETYALA